MLYGVGCLVVLGPTASQNLNFDPDMLTLVLLPPIIFYSGFSMEHGNFGTNLSECSCYRSSSLQATARALLESTLAARPVPLSLGGRQGVVAKVFVTDDTQWQARGDGASLF